MSTSTVQSPVASDSKPAPPRPAKPPAPKVDNIPDQLKARRQWVVWSMLTLPDCRLAVSEAHQ